MKTIRTIVGVDQTEIRKLDCADYAVGTAVGIERKTVGNLVGSMTKRTADGSIELWNQLDRCLSTYSAAYLIVEGDLDPAKEPGECLADGRVRKVPYLAVIATIARVQERGVQVVWTRDSTATALVLRWLRTRYAPMVASTQRMSEEVASIA